jgi:hypothetical protein
VASRKPFLGLEAVDRVNQADIALGDSPIGVRRKKHDDCQGQSARQGGIIGALCPLVEQGWQIDLTYSFAEQLTPRRVTLGARADVFDQLLLG